MVMLPCTNRTALPFSFWSFQSMLHSGGNMCTAHTFAASGYPVSGGEIPFPLIFTRSQFRELVTYIPIILLTSFGVRSSKMMSPTQEQGEGN